MKFNIKDIRDEGSELCRDLDSGLVYQYLRDAGVEPVEETASAHLELTISRAEETIFVRGQIRGQFTLSCARCLEPATITIDEVDVSLTFLPPGTAGPGQDEELELGDLDTFIHDNKQIDLEPVVREQLLLAIPITPLCSLECKGICESCGTDRNRAPCDCVQPEPDAQPEPKKSNWTEVLGQLKKTLGS